MNLGRANFRLFKELLDEISWEAVLREKGAEKKLSTLQGYPSESTRALHLLEQESKQGRKETSRAWQGPASQTEGKEETVSAVETRACHMGRKQGCCPDLQRGD